MINVMTPKLLLVIELDLPGLFLTMILIPSTEYSGHTENRRFSFGSNADHT
jgi:hypothetical protein